MGLRNAVIRSFTTPLNETAGKAFLTAHRWPEGLQESLLHSCDKIPIRFVVVDDSGSMGTSDGKRTVGTGKATKVIECTRWSELTSSLGFLAELAETLGAPTEFRLLNGADPVIVGLGDEGTKGKGKPGESLAFLKEVLEDAPGGKTPLCTQIAGVVREIASIQDDLRARGKKAAVIICTDGEATDGDVGAAMKPLEELPVWVVVRLCTDDVGVLRYWEDIDRVLELELDVLDDLLRDAEKINAVNGWVNYGEPLHRLREFGCIFREMDIINESKLTSEQMRSVMAVIYAGGVTKRVPHPDIAWTEFLKFVHGHNAKAPQQFDCVTGKFKPAIDIDRLNAMYGDGSTTSSSCCTM